MLSTFPVRGTAALAKHAVGGWPVREGVDARADGLALLAPMLGLNPPDLVGEIEGLHRFVLLGDRFRHAVGTSTFSTLASGSEVIVNRPARRRASRSSAMPHRIAV